ncbi:MAG: hypothetical protein OHK0022_48470 [Roseiflexaceae bacterium]
MTTTASSWLAAGIAALTALALGAFGFFTLVIGLNGFSESAGGTILAGYVLLLLVVVVVTVLLSRWGVAALTERTGWSVWATAVVTIFATNVLVAAVLMVGSFILITVVGPR